MRNRIFRIACLVTLFVLVITLVFTLANTYGYFSSVQEKQLKNQVEFVANGVETAGTDYFNKLDANGVRVTWISSDGDVLFDNKMDASKMENHLKRPEIQDALKTGHGESVRYSNTLLNKQLYYSKCLTDGSVVRISDTRITVLSLLLDNLQSIIILVLVLFLIGFIIASYFSKKIVEPINNIDLDNPMSTETYSELKPLLSRLDAQRRQIKQDKEELKKTERIREEFTSNVSHELKTPLHAISGYAELIQNGLVAEEDVKPFAGKIYDESVRMSKLVEDVIDLSKLDSGIEVHESEDTDLYRISENAVESLESFAKEKGVELQLTGSSVKMFGFPEQLHSIVYNLCDNAIKYNISDGSVEIIVNDESDYASLIVSDTGIGISEEHLSRIFERFYRVDKSHSKEVGGTGLGLSIVKHAAAMHNAIIDINSVPNKGTKVSVKFPKKH